jgi:polysaccharide export outer membrane protein
MTPKTTRRAGLTLLLAVLVLEASCGPTMPRYDYAKEPDPRTQEWVLGVGDQLTISVWDNPQLSSEVTIRPDGNVTMPLVGDLRAVGETPTSLKAKIKTRLADFVKLQGSEITIALRGANSYRFTVSGEVAHPGMMSLGYFVTVSEAIALAGGFTRFAKRNEMVLQRRDPKTGKIRSIPLAFDFLMSRPEMNIVLVTGDSLFVP